MKWLLLLKLDSDVVDQDEGACVTAPNEDNSGERGDKQAS
jgi:hypothetical protein